MAQKLKLMGREKRNFKKSDKKRKNKRARKITVENIGWSRKKKIKTATVNRIEKRQNEEEKKKKKKISE